MLPYERMSDIHRAASEGFSREVSSYTRGRPGYPDELLRWLRGQLRLDGDRTVVELGAGTGKFTQLLLQTGAELIAIEPVEAMREKLKRNLPGVKAMAGTAQAIPLKDRVANAVVCAQAFHWFATREALAQIHRVLKPGGYLGLIWNVRDESVDWVAAITEIISPYEGDARAFTPVPGGGCSMASFFRRCRRSGLRISTWAARRKSSLIVFYRSASSRSCRRRRRPGSRTNSKLSSSRIRNCKAVP
jgi:SAM-dependent methyltransferase